MEKEQISKLEIMQAAKPFLKWAGGKTQLINSIAASLPLEKTNQSFTYIEPFVGSGAVFFWMLNHFPKIEKAVINDLNEDLINTYRIIASHNDELISILYELQNEYHSLEDAAEKKSEFYYMLRSQYNTREDNPVTRAALFIFLNRTCFNGLYRVNRNNQFNVPMGSYKKPTICDRDNLQAVGKALQKVEILCGDYEATADYAGENTFFYFDPPYRPLNQTSSFNAYAKGGFDDNEQIRLRNYCSKLDEMGHHWMLSNSDVRGNDSEDNFFDDIYSQYLIKRVLAKRNINSKADKRGELNELLITNYAYNSTAGII